MKIIKFLYSSTLKFFERKALKELLINPRNKKTSKLINFFGRKHVTQSIADNGDVIVKENNGSLLKCDRREEAQLALIKESTFSAHIIDTIQLFIRPGTIFIDAGAHCGTISVPIALNNPSSKVIAIEPQKNLSERIIQNSILNNIKNLRIESIGLSSCEGQLDISIPIRNDGYAIAGRVGIVAKGYSGKIISETIKTTTIDALQKSENDTPISVIKIDTQGFEYEILKGSINTIARYKPALILEIQDSLSENPHKNRRDIKKLLDKYGYKVFLIENSLRGRYLSSDFILPMENDFLAIPF